MVGVGVWMGWDFQEVSGGAGGYVVASKFGSSFIVQVIFVTDSAYISQMISYEMLRVLDRTSNK